MTNLVLGPKFFKEVQNHYDSRGEEDAKMCLEKLQLLVTSYVDASQNVMRLKWWNVKCLVWENLIFQDTEVSNADFTKWLQTQHFGDRYVMTTFYFLHNFNARIFFFFLGMTPTCRSMKLRYLWLMKEYYGLQ